MFSGVREMVHREKMEIQEINHWLTQWEKLNLTTSNGQCRNPRLFQDLSSICDEASLQKYKLLNTDIFEKQPHRHRYLAGSLTSLRLCFRSLLILGIILNLAFHISAETMFTIMQLGLYQTSIMRLFLQNLRKFQQIGPKILKHFRKIYSRFIIYCSRKGFYDRIIFHNTDSLCSLTHCLV